MKTRWDFELHTGRDVQGFRHGVKIERRVDLKIIMESTHQRFHTLFPAIFSSSTTAKIIGTVYNEGEWTENSWKILTSGCRRSGDISVPDRYWSRPLSTTIKIWKKTPEFSRNFHPYICDQSGVLGPRRKKRVVHGQNLQISGHTERPDLRLTFRYPWANFYHENKSNK